jgi:SAM-dependent methyltransferase
MTKRLNWGCGASGEPGWINSDIKEGPGIDLPADIMKGLPLEDAAVDYAVSVHALPELPLDMQVPVLTELRRVIRPGGALRLVLPDVTKGVAAYERGDRDYFLVPDEDATNLGSKLIYQLVWYGYIRTLFVPEFIEELCSGRLHRRPARRLPETTTAFDGITELDNREAESLYVEAVK